MLYYQIQIDDYVSGAISYFDLFARKKDGFFFTIVKNGDAFNQAIISDLRRNGNKYIYIPMADKTRYLSLCSKLAKVAINTPGIKASL